MTLPGAYAPASIALGVIRAHKPPISNKCFNKMIVLGEELVSMLWIDVCKISLSLPV
jgi:hypothetical protein